MTRDQWKFQIARVVAFWPAADRWPAATVSAYFDMLEDVPVENVADAITALQQEGLSSPPNGGKILRKARESAPDLGVKVSDACICHEAIDRYRACTAGHPEGWLDRRRDDEQAREILDNARSLGTQVNPNDHPRLRQTIEDMLLREFYDANHRAGRAIQDAGDADGNPTVFAPTAKRWAKSTETPGEADEARLLGDLLASETALQRAKQHARRI